MGMGPGYDREPLRKRPEELHPLGVCGYLAGVKAELAGRPGYAGYSADQAALQHVIDLLQAAVAAVVPRG
jgi:hypothetical protein